MFSLSGIRPDCLYARRTRALPLRTVTALLLFFAISNSALAQRDVPLTLAEAESLALQDEPGQSALAARSAALEEQAVVAGALPDPTLRLGLNNYPIESGGFSTEGMTSASAGIRQQFPGGKTRSAGNLHYGQLAAEKSRQAEARGADVLMATRIAWLELYYWGKAHSLVTESRPFFDDLVGTTRSLYSVGRGNQQDVLRAELELSRLDDRLIEIERHLSRARAGLGRWIGPDANRRPADKLPGNSSPPDLAILVDGLREHPAIRAADARVAAFDAGVELAEQRSRPGWALDVGYSYREGTLSSGEPRSDFITVAVTVDMPFFRKKSVDSVLSAALQDRSAAVAEKTDLSRGLESELRAEHARWQHLSQRLDLYRVRILSQANDHAQAALLAYQSDRGDFTDVMRGYIDDLNTRIEHVRLRVELEQSRAVLANLGGFPR